MPYNVGVRELEKQYFVKPTVCWDKWSCRVVIMLRAHQRYRSLLTSITFFWGSFLELIYKKTFTNLVLVMGLCSNVYLLWTGLRYCTICYFCNWENGLRCFFSLELDRNLLADMLTIFKSMVKTIVSLLSDVSRHRESFRKSIIFIYEDHKSIEKPT